MSVIIKWPFYDQERRKTVTADITVPSKPMAQLLYKALEAYGLNPSMYVEEQRPIEPEELS